jgi:hypothetical protein
MSKLGGKVIAAFATFIAVLTYLAIGAAIFQAIEQEHEIEQRQEYDKKLNQLLDKVPITFKIFVTESPEILHFETFEQNVWRSMTMVLSH